MKKIVLALACTALATPLVFAQAKNFEGLSMAATLANTKTTIDSAGSSIDGTSTGLDLTAQYNWALGQEFVLGVGINLGTGSNKAGTFGTTDVVTKNRYALEFTPGFAISKDVLVYGKIASLSATADSGTSDSITGLGYGIGVRGMIDKNMFWQVGYDSNKYDEKNTATVKSTVLSFGAGYKF